MSSKQLMMSADDLLSLQANMHLTLSSSLPLGLGLKDVLPAILSSAAVAGSHVANTKPVSQKRRMLLKRTQVLSDCDCEHIERQSCPESTVISTRHNSSSGAWHHQCADIRTVQLESDSDAVGELSIECSSESRPPVSHMKLSRSGLNITRQKAFYNIERPLSLVRRGDSSSSTSDEIADALS